VQRGLHGLLDGQVGTGHRVDVEAEVGKQKRARATPSTRDGAEMMADMACAELSRMFW
jgi:hypothetical protein